MCSVINLVGGFVKSRWHCRLKCCYSCSGCLFLQPITTTVVDGLYCIPSSSAWIDLPECCCIVLSRQSLCICEFCCILSLR